MYQITTDPQHHRICITFTGSMSAEILANFDREVKAATLPAKAGGGWFDMLVDLTGAVLMPRELAAESESTMVWLNENGMRKSANVIGSALLKMQFKRVAGPSSDRFETFATHEEALAWLAVA